MKLWLRERMDPKGERGATLVFVVLSLVAMMGMVVLTVDVGGLLWKRREMVNASDAAALAAAISCASTKDSDSPTAIAQTYANDNVSGGTPSGGIIAQSGCDTRSNGYVTVRYRLPFETFFAGVLGKSTNRTVTTTATAAWGPTGADNPVPIVLYTSALQGNCDIPDVAEGTECYMWYDNDGFNGSAFGFLSLSPEGWDVAQGANCNASDKQDLSDWILGSADGGEPLPLNYPDPTWVCNLPGLVSTDWSILEQRIGDTLVFPVNDEATMIYGGGGQVDKYNVIGFASMLLQDVLTVQEAGGDSGSCGAAPRQFTASNRQIDLDDFGLFEGCFSQVPDYIENVQMTGKPKVAATDWSYDSATRTITWNGPVPQDANISFDWRNDGVCGVAPGNSSARCIRVIWEGATFGGSNPGGGADFGRRAVRLCRLDIPGSCPTGT
jgi:Flp pilus assembly protein TadG